MRESGFGNPQQILKALKKLPGFENYDKDGVQIFNVTFPFIDTACKRALELVSKQNNDPKEDPFVNVHLLIRRFHILKEQQNYFDQGTKRK
jgi:hypothetical protein